MSGLPTLIMLDVVGWPKFGVRVDHNPASGPKLRRGNQEGETKPTTQHQVIAKLPLQRRHLFLLRLLKVHLPKPI